MSIHWGGRGAGHICRKSTRAPTSTLYLDFLSGALDPRITFTRASTATFVGSNGLIQSAAINAPRFDYNPATLAARGLLIEEQRTNLMFPANGTTGWSASPVSSMTATANSLTSPDGTTNATKVATNDTLSNGHVWYKTFSGAISTAYVGSVYLKAGEYSRAQVAFANTGFANTTTGALFDLSNGTVVVTAGGSTATITAVGGGWYRCTVTATSDADGGAYVLGVSPRPASVTTIDPLFTPASVGLGAYVYGIQVEAGAFATSLIPTVSAQVTRSADNATMTGTNFSSWYNQTEGTFVASATSTNYTLNSTFPIILTADNGTVDNRITLFQGGSASNVILNVRSSGVSSTTSPTGINLSSNPLTIAGAYSGTTQSMSVNGGTAINGTTNGVPTVNILRIGGSGSLYLNYLNGHIRQISYYNTRIADVTLRILSA